MSKIHQTGQSATNAPASPMPRRPLSEAQKKVLPLSPIFDACKAKGLPITDETRFERVRAINRYFNDLPGFDWINESFKELLGNPLAITVVEDGIIGGLISW